MRTSKHSGLGFETSAARQMNDEEDDSDFYTIDEFNSMMDEKEKQYYYIPHQRELRPTCYCDVTYVCDECKKNPRKKRMDAI